MRIPRRNYKLEVPVITGPKRDRKVEDTEQNISDKFAARDSSTPRRYDQKPTYVDDYARPLIVVKLLDFYRKFRRGKN